MPINLHLLNPTRMLVGGEARDRVKLEPRSYTVGRNPRINDIVFPDAPGISRQHCTFYWEEQEECFYLWNKSRTGVFLGDNATPVAENDSIPLDTSIKIQLGLGGKKGANLVFEIDSSSEAFPETYHNISPDERSVLQHLFVDRPTKAPTPTKTPMLTKATAFLSYAHFDYVTVQAISLLLEAQLDGYCHIWMDRDITPGKTWSNELQQQLDQAEVVLPVLSPRSCKSKHVLEEIIYAQKRGKYIIPILIEGDDNILPLGLNSVQYVDVRPHLENAIQRVIDSINQHLGLR